PLQSRRRSGPPCAASFPYTTLFRSSVNGGAALRRAGMHEDVAQVGAVRAIGITLTFETQAGVRSVGAAGLAREGVVEREAGGELDRKSTPLNSSHVKSSYAVFRVQK